MANASFLAGSDVLMSFGQSPLLAAFWQLLPQRRWEWQCVLVTYFLVMWNHTTEELSQMIAVTVNYCQ